jgi:hypothetical protein
MGRHRLSTTYMVVSIFIVLGANSANASDLIWQVENPFRFFKNARSFALHEQAYNAVRGDPSGALPRDIVWRTERRLNDPDCKDSSTPDRCAATAGKRYQQSRLGWANQSLTDTCYNRDVLPKRYDPACDRRYSWSKGPVREDYVQPEAHTVTIRIAPANLEGVTGDCTWMWRPRRADGKTETRKQACKNPLTIARVPHSLDQRTSGVSVAVTLPDGRQFAERDVVVEDLFIVALGDSFGSGESNPDRPVQFSPNRELVYDPSLVQDEVAQGPETAVPPPKARFNLSSGDSQLDPKVLPRRLMEDELAERFYRISGPLFRTAFDKAQAQWLSRDCHRSQYGYPVRVAMQLALENRHRAVTLATFSCSGAEIAHGLFMEMDAREGFSQPATAKVRAQLDQLSDLMCRGGAAARTMRTSYNLPVYTTGSTSISRQSITMAWCPPNLRKRPIDVVLLSIGGNDVGFGGLVAYAMTESAADFAPIAAWVGSSIRFSTQVSRAYLEVLDERMQVLKDALQQGFNVDPSRVVQNAYEPIQYDETGALCGSQPTLGMDVHVGLKLHRGRLQETADFLNDFMKRLQCISQRGSNCPALATGNGTGFKLVTEHVPEFLKRGMCARDPKRAFQDGVNMRVPRRPPGADDFKPYSPAATLPYARHWRLFRTPNDAFLTAHTHREGVLVVDILQPAYAGLYSGAIHPTAEGHAIVADHVVRHARGVIEKRAADQRAAR